MFGDGGRQPSSNELEAMSPRLPPRCFGAAVRRYPERRIGEQLTSAAIAVKPTRSYMTMVMGSNPAS